MKKVFISTILLASLNAMADEKVPGSKYPTIDISNETDAAWFKVASKSGGLVTEVWGYGVDRKAGLCWMGSGAPMPIASISVPCDKLKVYPDIKKFIETGKLD